MTREQTPWTGWHWVGWVVVTGLGVFASAYAAWFILWGDSATCDNAPTTANRDAGMHHLQTGALVVGGVWLVAALATRRWGAMFVSAMLCLAPFALAAITHRHVAAWTGGLCF